MITTISYLVLAFIVLVALTSFAYASGRHYTDRTLQRSHELGYNQGKEKGHAEGYLEGFKVGREIGHNEGYKQGKEEGFADGNVMVHLSSTTKKHSKKWVWSLENSTNFEQTKLN